MSETGPGKEKSMKRGIGLLLLLLGCLAACVSVPPYRIREGGLTRAYEAFQEGRYREAVRVYRSYLTRHSGVPLPPGSALNLGRSYYALREPENARHVLQALIKSTPGTPEAGQAKLLIARIAVDSDREEEALGFLRSLLRERQDREVTAQGYLLRGEIFLHRNDPGLALSQFKKALLSVGEGPARRSFYEEIASVMERSLEGDLLQQIVRESPGEFPGDVALYVVGHRAWKEGDYLRASRIFKEFIERFPTHPLRVEADRFVAQEGNIESLQNLRIGCIVPQSGPLKGIGNQVLQGVRLSIDNFNSLFGVEKVSMVLYDSQGEPHRAASEMVSLTGDPNVVAVIGPVTSRAVVEAAMTAEEHSLPLITTTASAEGIGELGKEIFRNAMTNEAQARTIARYAIEQRDLHSFAVLYPDDYYGVELAKLFEEEVGDLGGEVFCRISYKRGSVDFGPEIRQIVDADISGILSRNSDMIDLNEYSMEEWRKNYFPSFDALYLPGYAEDVGLIAPQLAYYNIEKVQLLGSHNWNSPELIHRGERFIEGAVFTDGFFAKTTHTDISGFVQAYRHAYGEEPTLFSAQAYDAAEMILQVLLQGGRSREDIRKGLLAFRNYPGISGLTSVLPDGEMEKELFLIQVHKGSFEQIN